LVLVENREREAERERPFALALVELVAGAEGECGILPGDFALEGGLAGVVVGERGEQIGAVLRGEAAGVGGSERSGGLGETGEGNADLLEGGQRDANGLGEPTPSKGDGAVGFAGGEHGAVERDAGLRGFERGDFAGLHLGLDDLRGLGEERLLLAPDDGGAFGGVQFHERAANRGAGGPCGLTRDEAGRFSLEPWPRRCGRCAGRRVRAGDRGRSRESTESRHRSHPAL
jgi:hypothetical protein